DRRDVEARVARDRVRVVGQDAMRGIGGDRRADIYAYPVRDDSWGDFGRIDGDVRELQLPDANKVESAIAGGALIHDVAAQRTQRVERQGDGVSASRPMKVGRAGSAVAVEGVASGPGDDGAVDRAADKVLDAHEGIDPIEEGAKRLPDLPGLQVD